MIGSFDAVCLKRADEVLMHAQGFSIPHAAFYNIDLARQIMQRLIDEAEPLTSDIPPYFWLGAEAA